MSYCAFPVKHSMFLVLWEEIRGGTQKRHLGSTNASLQNLEILEVWIYLSWHGEYLNQMLLGRQGQELYEGSSGAGSFPLVSHLTSSDTGLGSGCISFLTEQSSSVISPIGGLQKCNDYFLHISTEIVLFSLNPVEVLSGQLRTKKQGTFLSFRGAHPTTQT